MTEKFTEYWMNEDPFGADLKELKTPWHNAPATYPTRKDTILWVMDDWRTMVTVLEDRIRSWKFSTSKHDYLVTFYISEDHAVYKDWLVQDMRFESDAITAATKELEGHGVQTYGIVKCELWYPF